MLFHLDAPDTDYATWLASHPTEDELRDAYFVLESVRAQLWTPGHIDSYRRYRYQVDQRLVQLFLRQVKAVLGGVWSPARSTCSADRLSVARAVALFAPGGAHMMFAPRG